MIFAALLLAALLHGVGDRVYALAKVSSAGACAPSLGLGRHLQQLRHVSPAQQCSKHLSYGLSNTMQP